MSTNSRERKRAKEYRRGLVAGDEGRKRQQNEPRIQHGAYWDGYQVGAAGKFARENEIAVRRQAEAEARDADLANAISSNGALA